MTRPDGMKCQRHRCWHAVPSTLMMLTSASIFLLRPDQDRNPKQISQVAAAIPFKRQAKMLNTFRLAPPMYPFIQLSYVSSFPEQGSCFCCWSAYPVQSLLISSLCASIVNHDLIFLSIAVRVGCPLNSKSNI